MPLMPPDLMVPFERSEDRIAARARLVRRDRVLRSLEELAAKPAADWTDPERALFPSTTNGIPDPPPSRLARWATVFAEEIGALHRLMSRPLSDVELRQADYLAGRLIATVADVPLASVDDVVIPTGHPPPP